MILISSFFSSFSLIVFAPWKLLLSCDDAWPQPSDSPLFLINLDPQFRRMGLGDSRASSLLSLGLGWTDQNTTTLCCRMLRYLANRNDAPIQFGKTAIHRIERGDCTGRWRRKESEQIVSRQYSRPITSSVETVQTVVSSSSTRSRSRVRCPMHWLVNRWWSEWSVSCISVTGISLVSNILLQNALVEHNVIDQLIRVMELTPHIDVKVIDRTVRWSFVVYRGIDVRRSNVA